jgi:hypothetical protein
LIYYLLKKNGKNRFFLEKKHIALLCINFYSFPNGGFSQSRK